MILEVYLMGLLIHLGLSGPFKFLIQTKLERTRATRVAVDKKERRSDHQKICILKNPTIQNPKRWILNNYGWTPAAA